MYKKIYFFQFGGDYIKNFFTISYHTDLLITINSLELCYQYITTYLFVNFKMKHVKRNQAWTTRVYHYQIWYDCLNIANILSVLILIIYDQTLTNTHYHKLIIWWEPKWKHTKFWKSWNWWVKSALKKVFFCKNKQQKYSWVCHATHLISLL